MRKGGLAPPEYKDYVLCKLFHCLPADLDEQDAETMQLYLAFYNAEETVKAAHQKTAQSRTNVKRR